MEEIYPKIWALIRVLAFPVVIILTMVYLVVYQIMKKNSAFKKYLVRDFLILMTFFQFGDLLVLIFEHKSLWLVHSFGKMIFLALGIWAIIEYRKEKAGK
ncbi:MAG: hypothetical protein A2044_02480 [Candidatus Firestonebacteria bacterium GWA2_43_8]|nr:MAG: hypothetical protein A2044_02480 [Candidatus Firestonebacteria bacterium GWA2_43_8]